MSFDDVNQLAIGQRNVDADVDSIGFDVTVGNITVGTVESASINDGFPSTFTTTELASNGSTVSVQVAGGDTTDTGPVTVGNATFHGHTVGETTVTLSLDSVGDDNGSSYAIAGSQDATLTVESSATDKGRQQRRWHHSRGRDCPVRGS